VTPASGVTSARVELQRRFPAAEPITGLLNFRLLFRRRPLLVDGPDTWTGARLDMVPTCWPRGRQERAGTTGRRERQRTVREIEDRCSRPSNLAPTAD
jgi:hypothetical protein